MKGPSHPLRCKMPRNHKSRVHYAGARPLDENSNGVGRIKGWTAVYVDGNVAATLTDEIARIELKWQSEDD